MNLLEMPKKKPKMDDFFESLKAWSVRKHRLLKKYLPVFNNKVGSWASKIHVIDGFAGPAKYEDGAEGSPLLIARLVEEAPKRKVNIINVECKAAHYASLCKETKKWVEDGIITNKKGKFGDLTSDIIREIGNDPAFFFIDPYGPVDVPFAALEKILQRSQSTTELIINFNLNGLRRLGDDIRSTSQDERVIKAIKGIVNQVNCILGSNEWQSIFTNSKSSDEEEEWLLNYYMAKIARYNYSIVAYPIRQSLLNMPKYYLLFCTRHKDGISLMNRFVREEEDLILEEYYEKTSPLISKESIEIEVESRRKELRQLIIQYMSKEKKTTRGLIKKHFTNKRFGCFHEKDYNNVVKYLINDEKIQPQDGRKIINDETILNFVSN